MAGISSLGVGSGLDLNGLLDQLRSAERQKLVPLENQKQEHQAKLSAFGKLESALSKVADKVAALAEPETFDAVASSVAGDAVAATVGNDAPLGTYEIDVAHRARAYSIATGGVADKTADLGAGLVTVDLADGSSFSIDVAAGESSLEEIRDAINAEDAGVQASIVDDGSADPYRLVFASSATGTDAAISSIDFGTGDLADSLGLDAGTEIAARDASLTVNGVAIASQGNRVEGAIEGVTLDLVEAGAATLEVERDADAAKGAVTAFVDAYNEARDTIDQLTRFDAASGSSGQLLGDGTVRRLESELRGVLGDTVDAGTFNLLSEVGIELELDGRLSVDDTRLDEVVETEPQALTRFFAGDADAEGLAGRLDGVLDRVLDDGGRLDIATDGLETSIEGAERRRERMEAQIESTLARYREEFQRLDSMIAEMDSVSTALTQQLNVLNGQA